MLRRTFLAALAAPPKRPHLVLFISDDHGYYDSPLYGSKIVRTPQLAALAAAGTVHTGMFVGSPTCVPSRAVMMTGLMPVRNGLEPNHGQLPAHVETLPTYLKTLGYHVAHFGKSHFNPPASYANWEAVPSELKPGPLRADLDTDAFATWLAARNPAQPLCLIVGCHSPHVYWEPNSGYDPAAVELPPDHVDTPETRQWRTRYYTDITKMDEQLGRVHAAVRTRLGPNTLFTYMADNGAQWPAAKWSLYDVGIRVPMVSSWPALGRPASRSDALLSAADILPTFIELAGGIPPPGLDGRSFAPLLHGRTTRHRSEIYATHAADGKMNCFPMRCIRTATHKYIRNLHPEFQYRTHIDSGVDEDGVAYWKSWEAKAATDPASARLVARYRRRPAEELYDLRTDPFELTNLIGRGLPIEAQLRRQLTAWMKAQGDEGKVFGTPVPLAASALPPQTG